MIERKVIELKPIKESTADFDQLEARIKEIFRKEIYLPLIAAIGLRKKTLTNSIDDLADAIRESEIFFQRGQFRGKFSASISKELKELGAIWDRKNSAWKIPISSLPPDIRAAIASSTFRFEQKLAGIDKKLAQILPEEIADKLKASDLFDRTLWKTDQAFKESVKGITVAPQLTPDRRKKIAQEWQENLKLYIKDFTDEEILRLRGEMKKAVFTGNRYESVVKSIQDSYNVSLNKAKFLARQETSLLMTKFKESRYVDSGVTKYKWGCVAGSKLHPVRPAHKRLEGKVFIWDDPPITSEADQPLRRNNPGQDYNCRCFARPIVEFKR